MIGRIILHIEMNTRYRRQKLSVKVWNSGRKTKNATIYCRLIWIAYRRIDKINTFFQVIFYHLFILDWIWFLPAVIYQWLSKLLLFEAVYAAIVYHKMRNFKNANRQFVLILDDKPFLNLYYEAMLMTVHKTLFLMETTCMIHRYLCMVYLSLRHNLANLCWYGDC